MPPAPFSLMAKPVGARCNLRCTYCFYREKSALYPASATTRMTDEVLEAYIRKYLAAQPTGMLEFAWQGGEPLLAGREFFRRAIELQTRYGAGRPIRNAIQTNGVLLDEAWCCWLARHDFLVGLSLDGPPALHDRYRRDPQGQPTSAAVLRALELLQRHGVEHNVLVTVNAVTAQHPLEVYRFLRAAGVTFLQLIPVVERAPDERSRSLGLALGGPPAVTHAESARVMPWSVGPTAYATFLIAVFDEWMRRDIGRIFVMDFEWLLCSWMSGHSPCCVHAPRCGQALILEHDGAIYACDHFVYPEHRLGNILTDELGVVVAAAQRSLGVHKEAALPQSCQRCAHLHLCRGGCPKHRFTTNAQGEPGLSYLCAGYREIYRALGPHLAAISRRLAGGLPLK